MKNVIIIGGMAAGCKTAARLSRLCPDYQITLIEKSPFISFSSCGLPLYASGEINDLSELNKTPYGAVRDKKYFSEVKGVKVLTETEVNEINADKKELTCRSIQNGDVFKLNYDCLVIATGSETIKPGFPFPASPLVSSFHSPADVKYFRQSAQKGEIEKAVIIGGGFIGCEMLEALSSLWGIETVLIESKASLLSSVLDSEISGYVENEIPAGKIQVMLSTTVKKIEINSIGVPVVYLDNGKEIITDFVFYCLGVKPDADLAKASGAACGMYGGILVDEQMRTSLPDVWAAGDCVEIKNLVTGRYDYFSFGSLSNRMGRVAADSIAGLSYGGNNISFNGSAGSISLKLFDNIICAAGLTEAKAGRLGYETGSVIGCWYDRPDYYPEAKNIFGKLVYEKRTLKLLGLQLSGEGEVTRYADVFSELLSQNKNVEDLMNLEHGYTPAHSSPLSPLNYLGYMAVNQETDGVKNCSPAMLSSFNGSLIDVREPVEAEAAAVDLPALNSGGRIIHVPLSQLRLRLNEFEADKPAMCVCERGTRAYEAARLLMNNGFKNVSYLGGGLLLYNKINKFSGFMEKSYER